MTTESERESERERERERAATANGQTEVALPQRKWCKVCGNTATGRARVDPNFLNNNKFQLAK